MKDMLVENKCIGKMSPSIIMNKKNNFLKMAILINKLKTSLLEAIIVNSLYWGYYKIRKAGEMCDSI